VKLRFLGVLILLLFLGRISTAQSAADASAAQNQGTSDSTRHFEGVPIITGGIALNASFEPHENNMNPVVAPIFLVPLGRRVLIESEVEVESDITYSHREYLPVTLTKSVEYAQLDFFAGKYLTIVAGRYATPFNIYKERFDARWIRNLSAAPLIFPLGDSSSNGASCGAPYRSVPPRSSVTPPIFRPRRQTCLHLPLARAASVPRSFSQERG